MKYLFKTSKQEGIFRRAFLLTVITVLINPVLIVKGHTTSAYSHEANIFLENSKWLSFISDSAYLSDLSLPGTHETLSRGYGGPISECQTLSLETQLKAGVRVVDIRCRHYENNFVIHHGIIYLHLMFGDVLNTIQKFLQGNPSETVLMRVKEEYDEFNVTRTFEETFKSYYEANPTLFWIPPNNSASQSHPKLGQVRGRIVVLDNFSGSTKYGLNYGDKVNMKIQDHFRFETNWDLYKKWELVKELLQAADVSKRSRENVFFINYLSAAYGTFPYFVASGHITEGTSSKRLSTGLTTLTSRDTFSDFPRLDCILKVCTISFEGTNVLVMEFLNKRKDIWHVGIIMADFPGDGLITTIINLNTRHLTKVPSHSSWLIAFVMLSIFIFVATLITGCIVIFNKRSKSKLMKVDEKSFEKYQRF